MNVPGFMSATVCTVELDSGVLRCWGHPAQSNPNLCIAKRIEHVINWRCVCVCSQDPENEGVWASWYVAGGSDHQHFPMPQTSLSWPFYIRYFCHRSTIFLWPPGRPLVWYWTLCYFVCSGTYSLICNQNALMTLLVLVTRLLCFQCL